MATALSGDDIVSKNDRPILITGCSSGIGYTCAKGLMQRGYPVFATARKAADVARLRDEGMSSIQLDLDRSESIQRALDELLERSGGRLYGLFNNGAFAIPGAVEELSRDALKAQFESNLFGWHELTCRVLPVMRGHGEGRIIQNSSVLGFVGLPFRGAYTATKFALEGLTDTLRLELLGSGIHVSLIEPGPIRSRFRANAYRAYQRYIDPESSPFRALHPQIAARLAAEEDDAPFTLGPEAVLKKLIHALEAPRPKRRYYVTFPTYLLAYLKRLLPSSLFEGLLAQISRQELRSVAAGADQAD